MEHVIIPAHSIRIPLGYVLQHQHLTIKIRNDYLCPKIQILSMSRDAVNQNQKSQIMPSCKFSMVIMVWIKARWRCIYGCYFFLSWSWISHIDGLAQDCSNSSALAMELLQSCTKPSICNCHESLQGITNIHQFVNSQSARPLAHSHLYCQTT